MLTALYLKNFIFIDELNLRFNDGMTVLTGETGAGKSILCDALWLALGAPCDKSIIKTGEIECHIEAVFAISNPSHLHTWLQEKGYITKPLDSIESSTVFTCSIKRVISKKSRGQLWINQKIAKIKDLQWLKKYLVIRHSQYDQQQLLTSEYQRECLDHYGGYPDLLTSVSDYYQKYNALKRHKEHLVTTIDYQKSRLDVLNYQLKELKEAKIKPNELDHLTQKQRQLSYAAQILQEGQKILTLLNEGESVHLVGFLQTIQQTIQKVASLDNRFEPICHTIERAYLEINEAEASLRYTLGEVVVDPLELSQVEERLLELHQLSRKHNVDVEKLPDLADSLQKEYKQYENNQLELAQCEKALTSCFQKYKKASYQLTKARQEMAVRLEQEVTQKIQFLGMPNGRFVIRLQSFADGKLTHLGEEEVIFYLSASPGQPLEPLAKGASGGELSRLSLVIQALIAASSSIATLIFDEVDVGVGGSIAEKMGLLLQQLSHTKQVLCITHLAQIAVLAKNHYCIEKTLEEHQTTTHISVLNNKQARVKEIARMLGGIYITDKTIAYAKSMLQLD